ncbi:polycomb complex protein BMI-1-like [Limulus polyphemus]|uniref:Polycomb complex protein BMI-1-like n=1 Tax=Limulus polyphemus TaxID=6850 RepID=A0ABM1BAN1_LIMPO|nr:polycomb complex protein BMI-1-like [Limulus polyphemus]
MSFKEMHSTTKVKLADLNPHLQCVLCGGYFIDATTITECLHSFCRVCIVNYLKAHKYCPVCDVLIHKTRPMLNIRPDQTLQDIVYKLVPGLFNNEMKRRREFYAQNPEAVAKGLVPASSEGRGEVQEGGRLIFTPEDIFSLSMEYSPLDPFPGTHQPEPVVNPQSSHRRYLRCSGAVTVAHLKKLLQSKYELPSMYKVEILYKHNYLADEYTIVDLAYIYSWRRNEPMALLYQICQNPPKKKKAIPLDSLPNVQDSPKSISRQNSSDNILGETASTNGDISAQSDSGVSESGSMMQALESMGDLEDSLSKKPQANLNQSLKPEPQKISKSYEESEYKVEKENKIKLASLEVS